MVERNALTSLGSDDKEIVSGPTYQTSGPSSTNLEEDRTKKPEVAKVDAGTGVVGILGSIGQGLNDLAKYEFGTKAADEFKEQALKQNYEKKLVPNPLEHFSPNSNEFHFKV